MSLNYMSLNSLRVARSRFQTQTFVVVAFMYCIRDPGEKVPIFSIPALHPLRTFFIHFQADYQGALSAWPSRGLG